jgi:hypothetical protein
MPNLPNIICLLYGCAHHLSVFTPSSASWTRFSNSAVCSRVWLVLDMMVDEKLMLGLDLNFLVYSLPGYTHYLVTDPIVRMDTEDGAWQRTVRMTGYGGGQYGGRVTTDDSMENRILRRTV